MGQTGELSNSKPPQFLERLVGLAVPKVSREHVLGDLCERYASPLHYLADAASAVPAALLGNIRRSTPIPYLLLEFILIYAAVLIAAFWSRGMGPIWGGGTPSLSKSAAAAAYLTIILIGRDAYRGAPLSSRSSGSVYVPPFISPETHRRIENVGEVFLSTFMGFGVYYGIELVSRSLNVFPGIMTTLRSVWVVTLLLSPLRLWLGTRKPRPERRA
jgi:hypothetical protein